MYLNCHSSFSLDYGTLGIRDLVTKAKAMGCPSLALTDINNVSGVFDFITECKKADIQPIIGVEFRNGDDLKYIVLAKNNEGFFQINKFLTSYLVSKQPFPQKAPDFLDAYTIYPLDYFSTGKDLMLRENEFIGVHFWEIPKLFKFKDYKAIQKVVALHSLTFDDRISFNLHRLLRAIGKNTLLSKLSKEVQANDNETFFSIDFLLEKFRNCQLFLRNTETITRNCNFEFDFSENKCKKVYTTSKEADMVLLGSLAMEGAKKRYADLDNIVLSKIEKELKIINELSFASYFLITWDLLRYARSRGFYHVGRGSGANSVVAYCLEITDVDPIELNLYFERFINPARSSPPDFDLDFSWDERKEILQYAVNRYGQDHVCLMATYNTYQNASPIRELGKVFGLPKSEIDQLVDYPENVQNSEYVRYIKRYAPLMVDMVHNLGIHAGGVLISEKPLYYYTALQPMEMGFLICQFDMYAAEDAGFPKFDILSQRGLGHIKMAVQIIKQNHNVNIDIHRIQDFKRDGRIKKQMQSYEMMGCFYVESPAMRQLMRKLVCDNYLLLVAASSIIRPGVSASGMMRAFIERHRNPHNIIHLHPKLGEILYDTYGVMIYQEDVIKVAVEFAGMSPTHADTLRRAMSGKYRSKAEFQVVIDMWFSNCKARGYSDELAKEVWRQVESFASYSFSKAHSASYAVESYQSLYLKTYYPREFITAVINNQGGFYSAEYYFHEAKRCGAQVEAPDINESDFLTTIQGKVIWMGYMHVKHLQASTVEEILNKRKSRRFLSFADFLNRVSISLEQLIILIRIGAFRQFGQSKRELLWAAHVTMNGRFKPTTYRNSLFESETPVNAYKVPVRPDEILKIEDAYDEIEFFEFPLLSPFELIKEPFKNQLTSDDLMHHLGKTIMIYGYYVTWKPVRTKNKKLMGFGYFIDQAGNFFDTTHFPQSLEKSQFLGRAVYEIVGKVVEEFGAPSIEVTKMRKMSIKPDPRSVFDYHHDESVVITD
jgi:DNA polymerase-3 subunit alpha